MPLLVLLGSVCTNVDVYFFIFFKLVKKSVEASIKMGLFTSNFLFAQSQTGCANDNSWFRISWILYWKSVMGGMFCFSLSLGLLFFLTRWWLVFSYTTHDRQDRFLTLILLVYYRKSTEIGHQKRHTESTEVERGVWFSSINVQGWLSFFRHLLGDQHREPYAIWNLRYMSTQQATSFNLSPYRWPRTLPIQSF